MKRDPLPLVLTACSAFLFGAMFAFFADVATDNDEAEIRHLRLELEKSQALAEKTAEDRNTVASKLKETEAAIDELKSMTPALVAMRDDILQRSTDRADGIELNYSIRELLDEVGVTIETHHIDSFIAGIDFAKWKEIHPEARILVCRRIAVRLHPKAERRFIEERARHYFDTLQAASSREPPETSIRETIALFEGIAAGIAEMEAHAPDAP